MTDTELRLHNISSLQLHIARKRHYKCWWHSMCFDNFNLALLYLFGRVYRVIVGVIIERLSNLQAQFGSMPVYSLELAPCCFSPIRCASIVKGGGWCIKGAFQWPPLDWYAHTINYDL